MDTRISSLSYIKLKHLVNVIKTKSISKTCTNYETKGKPRKKLPHPGIEPEFNKTSVCMERNSSTPIPLGHEDGVAQSVEHWTANLAARVRSPVGEEPSDLICAFLHVQMESNWAGLSVCNCRHTGK